MILNGRLQRKKRAFTRLYGNAELIISMYARNAVKLLQRSAIGDLKRRIAAESVTENL